MNIFVTDPNPYVCAKFLDDKRVVKMVLESTQMLSTALAELGYKGPYKPTHKNHPCNVWVRETRENYLWLCHHLNGLLHEYSVRYSKTHKCQQYLTDLKYSAALLPEGGQTPFPNCARNKGLGIDFTCEDDVFLAYTQYLNERWKHDKRKPTWYGEQNGPKISTTY